jgi:hypothetical protein
MQQEIDAKKIEKYPKLKEALRLSKLAKSNPSSESCKRTAEAFEHAFALNDTLEPRLKMLCYINAVEYYNKASNLEKETKEKMRLLMKAVELRRGADKLKMRITN